MARRPSSQRWSRTDWLRKCSWRCSLRSTPPRRTGWSRRCSPNPKGLLQAKPPLFGSEILIITFHKRHDLPPGRRRSFTLLRALSICSCWVTSICRTCRRPDPSRRSLWAPSPPPSARRQQANTRKPSNTGRTHLKHAWNKREFGNTWSIIIVKETFSAYHLVEEEGRGESEPGIAAGDQHRFSNGENLCKWEIYQWSSCHLSYCFIFHNMRTKK